MWVIRTASLSLCATAPMRAAAVFLLLAFADLPAAAQDGAATIRETLAAGAPPVTDIDAALGSEALVELKQVYAARDDRPIWLDRDAGRALLDRLAQPDLTIGPKLQPLLADARKRIDAADPAADLLLTALYGATAKALRPGAPAGFAAALAELTTTTDIATLLREPEPPKVETQSAQIPPVEAPKIETPPPAPATPPDPPEIARLKAAIAAQHDWPEVPDGPRLELGTTGARVLALSRRLIASGDLKSATPGEVFDPALKSAVEHFQTRHGLPADGVAGFATIAALNVPAPARAAMLQAALARVTARNWGDRYLVVNIPAARFRYVDKGRIIAEGPAILGTASTPTPLIDGSIDRIELHPSYRIPQSVADRQLWPRQEADALYFINHGIRVADDGLRQAPGAGNPLGPAKLLIAGNDRIALHGAPNGEKSQAAFDLPERYSSLGCVALPDIAAVVKPLLAADPAWTEGRIDGALAVGGTQVIALAQPLPVHVVYDTAWVDEDGTVAFRDDIYGWDKQAPSADSNSVPDPCGS
jgi:murein L,D-transpeptidase YcbB/YkuD